MGPTAAVPQNVWSNSRARRVRVVRALVRRLRVAVLLELSRLVKPMSRASSRADRRTEARRQGQRPSRSRCCALRLELSNFDRIGSLALSALNVFAFIETLRHAPTLETQSRDVRSSIIRSNVEPVRKFDVRDGHAGGGYRGRTRTPRV